MDFPIETVVLLGYLDQLLVEGGTREVTRLRDIPETLNRLYAGAMREHVRKGALLVRENDEWKPVPDWRLDRHVIRVGLYLRERLGVEPGQRVALLAELGPEWLIADLAALGVGAVSVAIDPRLRGDDLTDALEDADPSVTFVSAAAARALETLDGRAPSCGRLIALEGMTEVEGGATPLRTVLEMGGTLDTPERAQSYRAAARDLGADHPAIRHYRRERDGGWRRLDLSQGEVIERLRAEWLGEPARPDDLAYLCDPALSPAARLALYAFVGDGHTTTALASGTGEPGDLTRLQPTKIVAPAALLAEAVRAAPGHAAGRPGGDSGWVHQAVRLVPLGRERADRRAIRMALGGRARRIVSTDPLDSALAERLGLAGVLGPIPSQSER